MVKKISYKREIRNGGKVSVVTVPKETLNNSGLKEGDHVKVTLEKTKENYLWKIKK